MRNQDFWGPDAEAIRRHRSRGRGRATGWDGRGGQPGWGGPGGGPWGGPPPWVGQLFGPEWGGHWGGGPRRGGRPKVRRGDVRTAILAVLAEAEQDRSGPLNGYQLIQQITERTEGLWKPSPGSVYPTISQLVDEGLIDYAATGRKALQLTPEGTAYAEEHASELSALWAPFTEHTEDEEAASFKQVIGQTVSAIVQVATTGSPDQREKAVAILADTRRRLYGLLADGPDDVEDEEDDGAADVRDATGDETGGR